MAYCDRIIPRAGSWLGLLRSELGPGDVWGRELGASGACRWVRTCQDLSDIRPSVEHNIASFLSVFSQHHSIHSASLLCPQVSPTSIPIETYIRNRHQPQGRRRERKRVHPRCDNVYVACQVPLSFSHWLNQVGVDRLCGAAVVHW